MNKCPQCGYLNLRGALLCEVCSHLLVTKSETQHTRQVEIESEGGQFLLPATISRGTKTFEGQAQLTLELNGKRQQVVMLYDQEEISVGRVDRFTSRLPSINLTSIGAWENGVSRQHAALRRSGDNLFIIDLDSTNGTYLNNDRLIPYQPRMLHDGDVLRFGLFEVQVQFMNAFRFNTSFLRLKKQARLLVSVF